MDFHIGILASIGIPVLGAIFIGLNRKSKRAIEIIFVLTAICLLAITVSLTSISEQVLYQNYNLFNLVDGVPLAFQVEPLGILFACIGAGLFLVTTIYAIGYMNGNKEKNLPRFYLCFCLAMGAVMGIAYASNLLTLFIFYELLTLSTYPLVTHKGDENAKRGGRVYLGLLLTTSIGFLLVAILWTWQAAGTLDFSIGGILGNNLSDTNMMWLFALFAFGIGKAGLMPFHRWLPSAMVAPTPVSALLHAVAVVKAGVFCVLKITVYIFGIDTLTTTNGSDFILWVGVFTMVTASLIALQQDNLKARLAYSTVSQLAYIVIGASLATASGVIGGAMHLATHAVGKITLFFCAGAIYTATKKTKISEMHGLGKAMPFTFTAYTIAAISIIGLPPLVGSWSKWFLLDGAISAQEYMVVAAFVLSTLLNIVYLAPIATNAFLSKPKDGVTYNKIQEAPFACVAPLCFTAALCLLMFFLMHHVHDYLQLWKL